MLLRIDRGEEKMKCDNCKVKMRANESNEPACCKWFMDNVVIGGKSVEDCDVYETADNEKY